MKGASRPRSPALPSWGPSEPAPLADLDAHIAAYELAGFFLAHALWCVHDDDELVPLGGYLKDHRRGLVRFAGSEGRAALARARSWYGRNPEGADQAAIVLDGRITLPDGTQTDALICDAIAYAAGPSGSVFLPYTPASPGHAFRVRPPKLQPALTLLDHAGDFGRAVMRGLSGHAEGARVFEYGLQADARAETGG